MSIFKDILVANFFIKAAVPLVGLGLLAAMCSGPRVEETKVTTAGCDAANAAYVAAYDARKDPLEVSGLQSKAHEACGYFEGKGWKDPIEARGDAQRAALAAAEKSAAAKNATACSKLQDEYMSLSEDGRFYSDYMTYDRDAYADAQSKASRVIDKMHELSCPNARGNVGF